MEYLKNILWPSRNISIILITTKKKFCFPIGIPWTIPFQFRNHLVTKGRSILFNHFIDMRKTVNLSISCRKNVVLLKFSNKNTLIPHEMDKLTDVMIE